MVAKYTLPAFCSSEHTQWNKIQTWASLRKQPSLLAPRCWRHFARRNIYTSWEKFWSGDLIGWWCSYRYIVLAIVYKRQTRDKQSQWSNVNTMNKLQNSQYERNIFFFKKNIWVLLELVHSKIQNFTIIKKKKHKSE